MRKELSDLHEFNESMKQQASLKNSSNQGRKSLINTKEDERKFLLEKQKGLDLQQYQLQKEQKSIDLKKKIVEDKIR